MNFQAVLREIMLDQIIDNINLETPNIVHICTLSEVCRYNFICEKGKIFCWLHSLFNVLKVLGNVFNLLLPLKAYISALLVAIVCKYKNVNMRKKNLSSYIPLTMPHIRTMLKHHYSKRSIRWPQLL